MLETYAMIHLPCTGQLFLGIHHPSPSSDPRQSTPLLAQTAQVNSCSFFKSWTKEQKLRRCPRPAMALGTVSRLTKELTLVLHSHPIQGVKHGVARSILSGTASIGLSPLAVFQTLTPERPLIYFPFLSSGKGQSVVLQLYYGIGGLPAHVLYGILVAQPVAPFDGIVRVPPPVVFRHISESRIDSPLRRNRMRSSGKELGDASTPIPQHNTNKPNKRCIFTVRNQVPEASHIQTISNPTAPHVAVPRG